jgi:hypothetical protein
MALKRDDSRIFSGMRKRRENLKLFSLLELLFRKPSPRSLHLFLFNFARRKLAFLRARVKKLVHNELVCLSSLL